MLVKKRIFIARRNASRSPANMGGLSRKWLPGCELEQLRSGLIEYTSPITPRTLPEEAHRRVPRVICPIEQPKPVTNVAEGDSDRLAQCACQMRDDAIRHDHEIKLRYHCCGIRKISHKGREVDDGGTFR